MRFFSVFASALLVAVAVGFPLADQADSSHPDLVKSLPGIDHVPFRHFSGYLEVPGTTKRLHYWFVESMNKPESDPVVLWMNGGPGCSSMDGMLYENGPFRVSENGQSISLNPFSWNKVANVLYLEAPAGVGFSYATDKAEYRNNDWGTAKDNAHALESFFSKFPEFARHEFFITGESYGGVYVPTLATTIIESKIDINLKGIAVGNGISSFALNDNSAVEFAYYHGLFGDDLWKKLVSSCCSASGCNFHNPTDKQCINDVQEAMKDIYQSGINYYGIYNKCFTPKSEPRVQRTLGLMFNNIPGVHQQDMLSQNLNAEVPCIDSVGAEVYLNRPEVRKALHISSLSEKWTICSDILEYNRTLETIIPLYPNILKNVRALIYNGDTDLACNFLGDQRFVDSLDRKVVAPRRTWKLNGQVAGFVKEFDQITFLTVRGAGHMVPQDTPAEALHMLEAFLNNKDY